MVLDGALLASPPEQIKRGSGGGIVIIKKHQEPTSARRVFTIPGAVTVGAGTRLLHLLPLPLVQPTLPFLVFLKTLKREKFIEKSENDKKFDLHWWVADGRK